MSSWLRVKEVLGLALELPPDKRSALLDTLCAGEPEVRAEVESFLRTEPGAGSFYDWLAVGALGHAEHVDPHIGSRLGPYVIERLVGHGGMGAVYLARRTDDFEHSVAIKMIRRGMDSELVVRRFRHERQILASLNHPHIARLFDGGSVPEGLPYFVMEYVAGTPIDRYADDRRLTTSERLRLCLPVLDAVQHAHDHHIVHRDLKPSNVLVTSDGHPKLLDFGIAKILDPDADGDSTMTSLARPMTPDYASPEQILGQPITPATDVYALGLLLYELLTGHRPFRFTTHTPEREVAHRLRAGTGTTEYGDRTQRGSDGRRRHRGDEDGGQRQCDTRWLARRATRPSERTSRRDCHESPAQDTGGPLRHRRGACRRRAAPAGRKASVGRAR